MADEEVVHGLIAGVNNRYTKEEIDILIAALEATAVADVTLTVTGTAGATYTSTEQGIINALITDVGELKDQLNALLAAMRTAGTLET